MSDGRQRPYPSGVELVRVEGASGRIWTVDERWRAATQRRAASFYSWEEAPENNSRFVRSGVDFGSAAAEIDSFGLDVVLQVVTESRADPLHGR